MGSSQSNNSIANLQIKAEDINLSDEGFIDLVNRYGPVEVRDDGDKSIITQISGDYTFIYANLGKTGVFRPGEKLLPPQQ